jgi:hypothetical protein
MKASTSQSSEPAELTEAKQLLMLASETVLSLQEQRVIPSSVNSNSGHVLKYLSVDPSQTSPYSLLAISEQL